MSTKKVLVGVGVGLGAAYLISRFATDQVKAAINITIVSFSVNGLTSQTLRINVFNPTNNAVQVDAINASVFFNGSEIGVIQWINKFPIQPMGNTILDVPIKLTPAGVLILAEDFITHSASTGVIGVAGLSYMGGLGFPFSVTQKIW